MDICRIGGCKMSEDELKAKESSVEQLVPQEYLNTVKKTGDKYHSLYEEYAILLEKVEDILQQFKMLRKTGVPILWESVKTEDYNCAKSQVDAMLHYMYSLMKEAELAGVTIKKIQDTLGDIKISEDKTLIMTEEDLKEK